MKKLITAADVELMVSQGKTSFAVDKNTIVTAAAVDVMKKHGITTCTEEKVAAVAATPCTPASSLEQTLACVKEGAQSINAADLMGVIQTILAGQIEPVQEPKKNVFRIVPTRDVEFEVFDTGVPGNNVTYKELIGYSESSNISCGLLKLISSTFPWTVMCDEMDIVLEGSVTITVDGVAHVAKAGDVIYIPPKSDVVWSADEYAKLFYVTYPANWAELNA